MHKRIFALLALSLISLPAMAGGVDPVEAVGFIALRPVMHYYQDQCEAAGGAWTKDSTHDAWACRNSAGQFGTAGLPPGSKGVPLVFVGINGAGKDADGQGVGKFTIYVDGHMVEVTAKTLPKSQNEKEGGQ